VRLPQRRGGLRLSLAHEKSETRAVRDTWCRFAPRWGRVISPMMINETPQRRDRIEQSAFWIFVRAAVLCALVLVPCQLARAEYRLGILQLEREDTKDDPLSASFMSALRAALAERKDFTLVDTHVSLTQLSVAQDCDTEEAACLTRIARGLEIDGFIFGKWSLVGGNPVATVRRYDTHASAVNASALASFASREPSDAAMRGEVQKLVNTLLGPAPRGEAPRVAAKPTAKPRELPELAEVPTPERPDNDNGSGVDPRMVAAYALAGVAVASAAMAVVSFVQVDSASHDAQFANYRLAVGQSNSQARDVCDEASAGRQYGLTDANFRQAKSACTRGSTFEVLQFVFIGGAVVSAGVSALLFAIAGGDSDQAPAATSRLRLRPMAAIGGKGATGVSAQLTF
jgi:hypothetical protein